MFMLLPEQWRAKTSIYFLERPVQFISRKDLFAFSSPEPTILMQLVVSCLGCLSFSFGVSFTAITFAVDFEICCVYKENILILNSHKKENDNPKNRP